MELGPPETTTSEIGADIGTPNQSEEQDQVIWIGRLAVQYTERHTSWHKHPYAYQ
jgi:hypothetical protein